MLAARRMMNRRAAPTTPVHTDTFNRSDSATNINPASDGGAWDLSLLAGTTTTYGVSSNRGYISAVGATSLFTPVFTDTGSLDTDVTITNIRANSSGASIIWFCLDLTTAPNDGYGLEFDSNSFVHIIDYRTATQRESPVINWNTWWNGRSGSTLRIVFDHTTSLVTIYQDGVNIWSHTVSGAGSTGPNVGFASTVDSSTAGEFWDDFSA